MSRWFLGIDTSNYTTSLALWEADGGVMREVRRPLAVPEGRTGLRQNEALFQHVAALPPLLEELAQGDFPALTAVGASARPRDVEGSYMPCFLPGLSLARSLAAALSVPLGTFSHQAGHVAAALWSAGRVELWERPFLCWHVSGGTTELLYVAPGARDVFSIERVGGTNDLTAGQLIDRMGVRLGLPFPAGPALEALAGDGARHTPPPKVKDSVFSLSGLQNRAEGMLARGTSPAETGAFVFSALGQALYDATAQALEARPDLPVVCAGGVMRNRLLRDRLSALGAFFPEPACASDNAMGIALLAARSS